MYHHGEKVLTFYVLEGLNRIAGTNAKPVFSQYNMIKKPDYRLNDALKSVILKQKEIFPASVFERFDFKFSGDIMAMIDNSGNWLVSPYLSKVPNKPEDEDFLNIMKEVDSIKKSQQNSTSLYGYSKIGDNKYVFSLTAGFTPVE